MYVRSSGARPKKEPGAKIRETLEKWEEEGDLMILNDYGVATTVGGATLDLVIAIGNWEPGYATPLGIHLSSYHFPVYASVNIGQERNVVKYTHRPRILNNKEGERRVIEGCKKLNTNREEYTLDALAQAALDVFPKTRTRTKKRKQGNTFWNEELDEIYQRKIKHLKKHGRDEEFKEIDKELIKRICEVKNARFREFASGLDHRNRNTDLFWTIKNIGRRRPPRVAQLAIRDRTGRVVADIQGKANILAEQYQVPLGHHPVGRETRQQELKEKRRTRERDAKKLVHTVETASQRTYSAETTTEAPTTPTQIPTDRMESDLLEMLLPDDQCVREARQAPSAKRQAPSAKR
jgi:hypothetical protein